MLKTKTGWIQTTQSDGSIRVFLKEIVRFELLGVPLLLLLSLGVGYLLADRALKPVDQVSDLATRIARSGQAGERVPLAAGANELARLTRAINEMLSKLDAQMTRERLFAHASAHELRTPISVIRAATSLALEHERSPQQYRETLWQVHDVSEDLSNLIGRLLVLAQAAHPNDQRPINRPINLADVVLMATEMQTVEAQKKHIQMRITVNDAATTGDFNALVLAAGNLIQNAIKYSPAYSVLYISADADAQHVRLSVQDAGMGILAADIPRLTQPFQRGAQAAGLSGAGLGLALVQAIVDSHGGYLELNNSVQGGLLAEMVLPLVRLS